MKHPHLLLALLLAASTEATAGQLDIFSAEQNVISVQHDTYRGVTCWVLNDTALSCLPDSQLQHLQHLHGDNSPVALPLQNRAAPAAGQPPDGLNPASTPTPRRHREVFQL